MNDKYIGDEFQHYKKHYISFYFTSYYRGMINVGTIFKEQSGHSWRRSGKVRKTCTKCSQEIMLVAMSALRNPDDERDLHWISTGTLMVPESCSLVLMRKALL